MGYIVGVDEVGRGCWAGPLLVVAARAYGELPDDLKDSKLLSISQREEILNKLSICCEFGEGWVKPVEIDRLGLAKGLRLGVARALDALKVAVDEEIMMDGSVNYIPEKFNKASCLIKGDSLIPIISAASVYAKVNRDKYMAKLAARHPNYQFEDHVGYGTKAHMLALKKLGALKYVHRQSYSPIAALSGGADKLKQLSKV
ncbi:MAG TPA: ribonuclease HII [Candidatus Saccharimonadales bacterium]|nr:ribonuclease HII [Candidatus Saccharimonadales bacterium]